MARIFVALIAGLLFGAGLGLSHMIDPAIVLAFLDVASIPSGGWDPALAFVMAGALLVTTIGYRLAFCRKTPLFEDKFMVPASHVINARLIGGAVLFGIGWGLAGYCPGPAIAGLGFGLVKTRIFVGAMLLGMGLYRLTLEPPNAPPK